MYSINFTEYNKTLCLSLYYNEVNRHLFVNGTEIIKFKGRGSEIEATPLCLRNFSKNFSVNNMKNPRFYEYVYEFSIDYNAIAINNILSIHKYLMKKHDIKQCLGLSKKHFL